MLSCRGLPVGDHAAGPPALITGAQRGEVVVELKRFFDDKVDWPAASRPWGVAVARPQRKSFLCRASASWRLAIGPGNQRRRSNT